MPFPATCKLAGAALFFLLGIILWCGYRSPEPPTQNKAGRQETIQIPPALSTAVPFQPTIAFKEPNPSVADETIQTSEPSPLPAKEESVVGKKKRPRLAIIIDDMGYHRHLGEQLLHLDLNLTYSFLPDTPYTAELAETAFRLGRDILAHLPMEPKDSIRNPEKEALMVQDIPERIREKTGRMLAAVPHAIGANNHMGSRFTEDAEAMQVVIETLKNRSLFFIDSYTTAASQGWTTAQQLEVPTARRHIFLDTIQDPKKISLQIEQLITQAKKRGWAIGIGHPNEAMLTALIQWNRTQLHEVEIVGVHQLVQ